MKSRMKKTLGFLTVLCLAAGILPLSAVPAFADTAAGTGKAMQQISADNSSGGIADGDHIYLGTKDETNYTWTDASPYWRVLDADKMNTGGAGMFVMSESLIGNNPGGIYGNIYFNQDDTKGIAWQGSDARSWCGGFLTHVFSKEEQAAIASADKDDAAYQYHDNEFGASSGILHGDRVFFLSAEEADSTAYGFADNASRNANYVSGAGYWWLRSPYAGSTGSAGFVLPDGGIAYYYVGGVNAARPALNIKLSSVLFTSAAEGGKSSGAVGADSLTSVSDYSGSDWKLTLSDSARSEFTASFDSMSGDVATIKYSGAKAGTNEYISAVIINSSGEITYYGNLALAEAGDDKTVTVDLAGKYNDRDTLYVFNEQTNGDKKTDYSSKLKKIEIPAETLDIEITGNSGSISYSAAEQSVSGFTVKYKIGEGSWTETTPADVSVALKTGVLAESKGTNADSYSMGLSETSFDINPGSYTLGKVTVTDGVLTIGKAALTITAADQEYVYDGKIHGEGDTVYEDPAQIAEKVTVGTLQGNDYLYSVVLDGQGQEAGEYDIVPSGAAIYRDGNVVTDNYEINYVNGILKITAPAASYTVSFSANGGSGTMDEVKNISGNYELPKCLFKAPEGKTFDCWLVDGSEYAEGDTITVESDITVTAQWKEVPPAHVHNLSLVAAEEATCTETGNTAYYTCDGCDLWFEDATGLVEITDKSAVIVKALGHEWDKGKVTKEPTETEDGIRTYTCLHDSSHTKEEIIPATGHEHSLTKVDAVKATCTEAGNTAYYICDSCGLWFKDADGKMQITDKSSVAVKALGHKWDSGVVTKEATYTAEGIRTFTCLNDSSHTKTEPIPKKERQSSGSSDSDSSSPVVRGAWDQDTSGWHYRENGTLVSNAWRFLSYNGRNYWYYFGENGIMQTGWLDWKGNRYYLYPVSDGWMGRMLTGWQLIDGKWYYFETAAGSTQGRMYRSERTLDGSEIDLPPFLQRNEEITR